MTWDTIIQELPNRLSIAHYGDLVFRNVQRIRQRIYIADGFPAPEEMRDDRGSIYFVLDDPPSGAIWWKLTGNKQVAWGGGWFVTERSKPYDGALLILIAVAQSINSGVRYGWSTVTKRHNAHRILKKIGFYLKADWEDPDYLCPIEWVEIDLVNVAPRYRISVEQIRRILQDASF